MENRIDDRLTSLLPKTMQRRLDGCFEALEVLSAIRDPGVLRSLGPSGLRAFIWKEGKQGIPTLAKAAHSAHFDWRYPSADPQMRALYTKGTRSQWLIESLPWSTSVDPLDPARSVLPADFVDFERFAAEGVTLDAKEKQRFLASVGAWILSQILHGEQGALFAAAQVLEAVPSFEAKLCGAAQVMDEARHVDVFHRYVTEKLGALYPVNDGLFAIIDALMRDARWDIKFLGMQIMVEGLALGAFGMLYKMTREPLLKQLLKLIIQDEARHVHFGLLSLRDHLRGLGERERREREDWTFHVAILMRNRFLAFEVYEEWFEGSFSRATWRSIVEAMPGMREFRKTMFTRLVPNLREIGLLTPRMLPRYEGAGLIAYMGGLAADRIDGEAIIADLDRAAE